MKLLQRLKRLEAEASKLQKQMAVVFFKDGTTRRMTLPDVIPLLKMPDSEKIVSVSSAGTQEGKLSQLVNGLLEE